MGFRVLGSYSTVKVLPGDLVFDAEYVSIVTTPTGITATYAVPIASWQTGAGVDLLTELADGLEALASNHHVIAGSATQDLDDAGFLADYVDLTVVYAQTPPLGNLTGVARVPVDNFFAAETGIGGLIIPGTEQARPDSIVDAEYERLAGIAGG